MKNKGTKLTCDVCGKEVHIPESDLEEIGSHGWRFGSEIGDLCPTCSLQWEDWKSTFVVKIRKEAKGDII